MKSHPVLLSVLATYAVNQWLFNAQLIRVQLKRITSAKRKFQILQDYAGICQKIPDFATGMA